VAIWRDLEAAAPEIARLGSERFVHSAVSDRDSGEGELKLYGRATEAEEQIREGCPEGWWAAGRTDAARVFSLDIERATFVSWDIERGGMTVRSWSPHAGYRETRRDYP